MKPIIAVLLCVSAASAQRFEQPRQQVDFYGGGSYQVGVTGSAVLGVQVRQNVGRRVGIGGYYNFAPGSSLVGAGPTGIEYSVSRNIQDYGIAVEVHSATKIQPYILGTFGGVSLQDRGSAHNYLGDLSLSFTESHIAYGAGVGVRFNFSRRCAFFVESRVVRAAVSSADYFVRGTVGLSIALP